MSNIEKSIIEITSQSEKLFPDKRQLDSFEEALKTFNDLINQGLIKPRGYNLQTIEDSMSSIGFNVMA